MRVLRLLRILSVGVRFGLDEFLPGHERMAGLRALINAVLFWRRLRVGPLLRLRA